jgi:RNA polymerase sigma-70 factor (ECF subfamily)
MQGDAELMVAFIEGDEEAFTALVEKHHKSLINYFNRLVHDQGLAEDYTQEVFFKIYRFRERYVHTAKFTTFMFRVAHNLFIDQHRKIKDAERRQISLNQENSDGEGHLIELPSKDKRPIDMMEQEEQLEAVRRAVVALPEDLREVFILSQERRLPYKEISGILNIPVGTVKSRVYKAFQKLKEILNLKPAAKKKS